ncbi:hypothetical protein PVK06_034782 [Gossypium arboreum]|uniref:Leucine-rich repeat-containing N-terminal plant-type domain-containing protein n=1 Tax=Gossypium arboreum TaxID=29729 RepID=A0ABR0NFM1_GOSAR|nr:hypothetical protein PVK06_034782 [Gossypium arboreum]
MAIIILLVLIILAIADVNSNNEISSNSYSGCPENEKQALLVFKEGLIDDANRLASWDPHHHPDCCIWFGVVCGNMTGHILSLNLSFPPLDDIVDIDSYLMSMLKGKINPCLSNLKHLRYLDLSNNAFEGLLPYQLGNLSNLESLNLRGEDKFNEAGLLYVENLQWLSGLSLLKHLDLSLVDLSRASNWLQLVNTRLPSLEELHLSNCFLQLGRPLLNVNLSTLAVLDLSYNFFTNQMNLGWVSKLNSLVVLNLAGSDISSAIFNISTLNELYLSWNDLEGKLPRAVGKLCNLRFESLAFASCQLSGQLTDQLEHFKNLKELSLNDNSIFGPIPTSLGKLANLEKGQEFLVLQTIFYPERYRIAGSSPTIRWQQIHWELVAINLGKNELDGDLPGWLGQDLTNLIILILRSNKFGGSIRDHLCALTSLHIFDLADNNFFGSIPRCISNFTAMVRGNGSWGNAILYAAIAGPLSESASVVMKGQLLEYDSTLNLVKVLDFSRNKFSGKIPHEVTSLQGLQSLNLFQNHLSGKIPENISGIKSLESLDLS